MECGVGDVVEVIYLKAGKNTATVFGEVLRVNEHRLSMSIWDAPQDVMEYDEINIEMTKIVSIILGGTVEDAIQDALYQPGIH